MHRFASIQNVTDRQTDRRHRVAKARPIVRSAKNSIGPIIDKVTYWWPGNRIRHFALNSVLRRYVWSQAYSFQSLATRNLTQNGHSRSFKVTYVFWSRWKCEKGLYKCSEISCNVKWNVYLAMEIPDRVSFVSGQNSDEIVRSCELSWRFF